MKILIVGSGGREHAIAWKCAQSAHKPSVMVAPGNAGTQLEPGVENIPIDAEDIPALLAYAQQNLIDLTIVGPEVPLVEGIVDRFEEAGLKIFGPASKAAQLEGSKAFTKAFLERHKIPTASYKTFTDLEQALAHVRECGAPIVIKADGLAAGKGVVVAMTIAEAESAIHDMMSDKRFGQAGEQVVIEEFMQGEEASFICLVAGRKVLPLATSQDHKARDEGDKGPNTGGMGAYSPAPVIDQPIHDHILQDIIYPTVNGLADDDMPFTGFLYAGLMIKNGNARVVEFNVRLGDPETQPLLMRFDSDLVEVCLAALDDRLDKQTLQWTPGSSVGVVMAAGGYPESYNKGDEINGLDAASGLDNVKVFHAGTRFPDTTTEQNKTPVTNGGRVLCVVGVGESVTAARNAAYTGVDAIAWSDAYYRKDIAYRALERETRDSELVEG